MRILVVMGVSGSGKTTVGKGLADELGWTFYEGDGLHPRSNVEKMSRGIPLNDEDRRPWLEAVRDLIGRQMAARESTVITCSALKQAYRDFLSVGHPEVVFVYLKASFDLLHRRLAQRKGHYMPASLLTSQLQTLEEPTDAITVDAGQQPELAIEQVLHQLKNEQPSS